MKRRILSFLLVLLMVMSLVPMSALAVQNYQANEEPAWEQYTVRAVDYEHACFSFVAVFGKTANISKTGIDLYNKDGKLTYSAEKTISISSSRIKLDYTVPYKGKTLMTAELYVVADGKKYGYSVEFNMIHIHDTGDKIIDPTCTEGGYTLHGCTCEPNAYKDTYTSALGHEFADGKCTRCGISVLDAFTDVKKGSYCSDAVQWAVANGITSGVDATHFGPNGTCTRAHAVTFLWRAAGQPEPKTTQMPFKDVKAGSYYEKAVLWAVENKITNGTSTTTFSPDKNCTRAQIVTFLWRSEGEPYASDSNNPFTDIASGYYMDAVFWAVKEGITNGTTPTTFSPNDRCTRAQIVTFIYRAMHL